MSCAESAQKIPCPQNSNDSNEYPKSVENSISAVFPENGTPGKEDGICRIEYPYEHERTFRSKPANKAEAKDTHENADHFDGLDIF